MKKLKSMALLSASILVVCGFVWSTSTDGTEKTKEITLSGASVLAFGPDNVLFVGDSKAGKVLAVQTEATELKDPVPYNLEDFDLQLAEKLGIDARNVIINDMKVHPISQEAYIAVRKGFAPDAERMIAVISPVSPTIRFLDINESNSSSVIISNPASDELVFWKEIPASALSITDIDYHDGFIYVAGLTNGEFASTIRKIAYPFNGNQTVVKGIEIYHAVHTQNETRAPIRTMLFDEIDGKSTLLASYTCTPLVTIPTSEIKAGNHIVGKTIAELGYGNAPIDMLTVMTQSPDGSFSKQLLVTHKNRGGTVVPFDAVIAGAKGAGMAGMQAQAPTGLEGMVEIPTANVMQVDVQNQMMLTILRRNMDTGGIDLVSELTGVYLRLSDFIAEYDFPDYQYDEKQAFTKKFHDMIKPMEGYPDLTSEKTGK